MKLLTLILLFTSTLLLSQKKQNSIKVEKLMEVVESKKLLLNVSKKLENRLLNQRDSIFTYCHLKVDDTININEYNSKVKKMLADYIISAENYIYNSYIDYETSKIDHFIEIAESNITLKEKMLKTDFYKLYLMFHDEENDRFKANLLEITDAVKANEYPLKLCLYINNIKIDDYEKFGFDLYFFTSNKKYKKISVLNKKSGAIEFPKDLKQEDLLYLTIAYKGKEVELYNPRIEEIYKKDFLKKNVPNYNEILESIDKLPKKCFEEKTEWIVGILDSPEALKRVNFKEVYGIKEKVNSFLLVSICSDEFTINKW